MPAIPAAVPVASAVTFPPAAPAPTYDTRMEIDGNKPVNGAPATNFDWTDIQDGTLPGPYTNATANSTGIVDYTFQPDLNAANAICDGSDTTANPVSQFPDDNASTVPAGGSNFNGWQIGPTGLQDKVDICTGAAALEIVQPTSSPTYDQLHFVLYQYWTRAPSGTGSIVFFTVLAGPLPGRCDDRLIKFDFDPSGGSSSFTSQSWQPTSGDCTDPFGSGTWVNGPSTGTVSSAGPNLDTTLDGGAVAASPSTFAESAVDLTALGIVPAGQCVNYTAAGFFTQTGNEGQLQDFVAFSDPIVITNCNSLTVSKVSEPAGLTSATPFTYTVTQQDGRQVHDATLSPADTDASTNSITSPIQIGQTQNWNNVIAEPDYVVTETVVAPGWQNKSVVCTYRDLLGNGDGVPTPGQPGFKTVTISTNGVATGADFDMYPPQFAPAPSCVITNTTAGITIVKDAVPNDAADFAFAATGTGVGPFSLDDDADATLPNQTQFLGLSPGAYTFTEAPTAGWDLTGLVCADPTGNSSTAGSTAAVTLDAGEVVTCTFTNTKRGSITIVKDAVPGTDPTVFDYTTAGGLTPSSFTLTDDGTPGANTRTYTDLVPGAYAVTEAAESGWTLGGIVCADPNGDTSTNGPTASIDLDPGEAITCTYTNDLNTAEITLTKEWGPGPLGDAVSLSATGSSGQFPAANGSNSNDGLANDTDAVLTVRGGETVTLGEAFAPGNPANYATTLSCVDSLGNPPIVIPVTNLQGTLAIPGEPVDMTCTFLNTRKSATLRLEKAWVNAAAGDQTSLAIDATNDASIAGVAAPNPGFAQTTVYAGETGLLSELLDLNNLGAYTPNLTCNVPGLTYTAGASSGSYAVASSPVDVTCTITNTRQSATISLAKTWANAKAGDEVDLTIASPSGGAAQATSTAPTGAQTSTITVLTGETVNLDEAFAVGDPNNYTTTLGCPGTTNAPAYTPDALTGQLVISKADGGATIVCTFTNSRGTATVVVAKQLTDPLTPQAAFDLSVNGTVVFAGARDNDASLPVIVNLGDSVDVDETANAAFTSTLSCVEADQTPVVVTPNAGTSGSFVVPASAENQVITCTFTNSRKSAPLTLQKVWVDGAAGDTANLAIDGVNDDTAISTAPDAPSAGNSADVVVYAGETVNLSEGLAGIGSYSSTLACTDPNGLQAAVDGQSGTYTMPAAAAGVTCTFTNTRDRSTLTLQKAWVNGANGDTAGLTATGDVDNGTDISTSDGTEGTVTDTANAVTIGVLSGETIDLAEVLGGTGSYSTTLACGGSQISATISGNYTVPQNPTPVTCTFTNTRRTATLVLTKVWPGLPAAGESVGLTASGDSGFEPDATGTSNAPATGTTTTLTVYTGETVALSEAFGTPANVANYATTLACTNAAGQLTYVGGALAGSLPIVAADAGNQITCTFENTRRSTTLTLQKVWVDGAAGDTAGLAIGGDAGTSTPVSSTAPDAPAPTNQATLTVYAGENVGLGETLSGTGSYDTTLFCGLQPIGTTTSGSYTVPASPQPTLCTFTNTRQRSTLTLHKTWVDAATGDTAELTLDGTQGQPTDTSTATGGIGTQDDAGNTVTLTVLSGEVVTASEAITGVGVYGITLECTGPATLVYFGGPSGTVTAPKQSGGQTDCLFTNTAGRGTILVAKSVAGADRAFTFNGTWAGAAGFDVTTAGGTGQQMFGGVLAGTYTVGELVPAGYVLTGLTCVETSPAPDEGDTTGVNGTTGMVDLDAGESVLCTFTNAQRGPLDVTKTVTSGPTLVSGTTYRVVYEVEVTSASHIDETYDLSDTLQFGGGFSVVSATASPAAPGWTGTAPNTALVTGGTIPALGTVTHTITVDADTAGSTTAATRDCVQDDGEGTGFLNSTRVTWEDGTDDAEACAPIPPVADVAVVKTADPASVTFIQGQATPQVGWSVVVTNNGPVEALGVTLDDNVPAAFSGVTATTPTGACSVNGQAVHCDFGTMAFGASITVTIGATVADTAAGGTYTNIAVVASSSPPDPNLSNNTDSADTSVAVVAVQPPTPPNTPPPPTTTMPPPAPPAPPNTLPVTGGNTLGIQYFGALAIGVGLGAVAITRRRRRSAQP